MSSSELHTLQKNRLYAGGKWSTFIVWAKTPSRWDARITNASNEPSFTAGKKVMIGTGAVRVIRAMSGL